MSNNLKKQLIRLGSTNPDLQKHLRPIIDKVSAQGDTRFFVRETTNANWWGLGGDPRLNEKGYKTEKAAKAAILRARKRAMSYHGPVFYIEEREIR